jgi:large subunit ribosomal protein L21
MYAIIEAGGLQYRVAEGDVIRMPLHIATPGETQEFDQVLLVVDGEDAQVGNPTVEGARVEAEVVHQGRDEKVLVFKKKRRTKYRRMRGHRQDFTDLKIGKISVS